MPLSLAFDTAPPADQARARVDLGRVVAVSGRGGRFVVAEPGRVRVFEGAALRPRWEQAVEGAVRAVALAADGLRVAVGGDRGVRVCAAGGWEAERPVPGGATALAFGAGDRLVAGSGSAATWIETDAGWGSFTTHARQVLAVDRDGPIVLSGGADAQVAWTDLDAGRAQLLQGHVGAVRAVRLLPGGRALSGSEDGTVRLWAVPEGRCLWTARPPTGPVFCLDPSEAGVLVGGDSGLLAVLSPDTGETRGVLLGHRRPVAAVGAGRGGGGWSVALDRTARAWTWGDAATLPPLLGHRGGVRACASGGGLAWTGGRDGMVRGWDLGSGRERVCWSVGRSAVQALLALEDGALLAGCADGRLVCRAADGSTRWQQRPAHEGPVTCLGQLPAGVALSGGADGALRAWDPASGAPLWAGAWHGDRLRCLAVAPDGRVATGGYDGVVRLGEPLTGAVSTVRRHDAAVVGVAVCGGAVVSGSLDGRLRAGPDPGGPSRDPAHPDGVVGVVALDPRRVATIGRDGWLRTWRAADLAPLDALELGVPLDGLGAGPGSLLVGDRRGGVHVVSVSP